MGVVKNIFKATSEAENIEIELERPKVVNQDIDEEDIELANYRQQMQM